MTCLICADRDAMAGSQVCLRCKVRMGRQLTEILEAYAITEAELTPGSGSTRGTDRPIGVRVSALSALAGHDLLGTLGSWERDWRETLELAPAPTRVRGQQRQKVTASLAEIVGFLQRHLDLACRASSLRPARPRCRFGRVGQASKGVFVDWNTGHAVRDGTDIAEFAHELKALHLDMVIAGRLVRPVQTIIACPTPFDDGPCGTSLVISQTEVPDHNESWLQGFTRHHDEPPPQPNPLLAYDLDELPEWLNDEITCPLCLTKWTASRLMAVATSDPDYAMTSDALQAWLKVTDTQLCRWANAGRIRHKAGLFNLADTREAIFADQQTHTRKARPPWDKLRDTLSAGA